MQSDLQPIIMSDREMKSGEICRNELSSLKWIEW